MHQEKIVNDEIDLRAIIQILWKARLLIIIATLAVAAITFGISDWFLPHQYQATAYLFVGKPAIGIGQVDTLTIASTPPDLKTVVRLATSPDILDTVLNDKDVAAAFKGKKYSLSDLTDSVTAVDFGKDQIILQVTDTDPLRAALVTNVWASKLADSLNATYGLGNIGETLAIQISQIQNNYAQAQTELEDALSKNQSAALTAQLNSKQTDLSNTLTINYRNNSLLADLKTFEDGLSNRSGDTSLSLDEGLTLIILRQRSLNSQSINTLQTNATESNNINLQVDNAVLARLTISDALAAVARIRSTLQNQQKQSQNDQTRLEQEIPLIQRDLENAQAKIVQLTSKRDQSQKLYTDLLQQQSTITALEQDAQVSSVSAKAVPPTIVSSPKVLQNTILAGLFTLILSIAAVLFVNWWRNK